MTRNLGSTNGAGPAVSRGADDDPAHSPGPPIDPSLRAVLRADRADFTAGGRASLSADTWIATILATGACGPTRMLTAQPSWTSGLPDVRWSAFWFGRDVSRPRLN